MTALSATQLRKELFRHLDEAIASGRPLMVKRKGEIYAFRPERVAAEPATDRWARYDAWIAARRASGELPAQPREDDEAWFREMQEATAEGLAEMEKEWDELYGPEKS
jgi:hypothetical protein